MLRAQKSRTTNKFFQFETSELTDSLFQSSKKRRSSLREHGKAASRAVLCLHWLGNIPVKQ